MVLYVKYFWLSSISFQAQFETVWGHVTNTSNCLCETSRVLLSFRDGNFLHLRCCCSIWIPETLWEGQVLDDPQWTWGNEQEIKPWIFTQVKIWSYLLPQHKPVYSKWWYLYVIFNLASRDMFNHTKSLYSFSFLTIFASQFLSPTA